MIPQFQKSAMSGIRITIDWELRNDWQARLYVAGACTCARMWCCYCFCRTLPAFPTSGISVLNYFKDTHIGNIGRPTRCGPRRGVTFPVTMWNVYDRVNDGLPRTNNAVEGWDRAHAVQRRCSSSERLENSLLFFNAKKHTHILCSLKPKAPHNYTIKCWTLIKLSINQFRDILM